MSAPSIRRQLIWWVLGALCIGAPVLALAAYWLTLGEIDEVLNDSLKQTALLLADRDLRGAISGSPSIAALPAASTESQLIAIARRTDGSLLFTSEPETPLRFEATPGTSIQRANGSEWHVFTVVQADRIVQVAQPTAVRRESAAESASQLLVPLAVLIALIGGLLVVALRRGMRPLAVANDALARRNALSLEPLALSGVPVEVLPVVQTLNDLLQRLAAAFAAQRNFVADAAHELRSPITALQLQVQILERSRDAAERALATTELSAGIGRARRLIEQLLELSRASADDGGGELFVCEPVRLAELARAVVVRWAVEAERRGIDLGADASVDASVQGDAAQLEILLNNLVENALRYTPRGGIVDVVTGLIDAAPVLRVIDDGPGIAPAERARVFDRFYRSPEAEASLEPGSGLGLAIVKSIADRHGALISLHEGHRAEGQRVGLEVRVRFSAPS
ncbi:MAG: ATP-binding protein [Burkholderiales bacterium]